MFVNVPLPQKLVKQSELFHVDREFSALSNGVQMFVDCFEIQCKNGGFVKCRGVRIVGTVCSDYPTPRVRGCGVKRIVQFQ